MHRKLSERLKNIFKKKLCWLRSGCCCVPLPWLSLLRHHMLSATFVLSSSMMQLFGLRARPPCVPGATLCVHNSDVCLSTPISRPLSHRVPGSAHPVLKTKAQKRSLLPMTKLDVPPPCQTKIQVIAKLIVHSVAVSSQHPVDPLQNSVFKVERVSGLFFPTQDTQCCISPLSCSSQTRSQAQPGASKLRRRKGCSLLIRVCRKRAHAELRKQLLQRRNLILPPPL